MSRPSSDKSVAFGSDSFLDVLSNIVGILIVLIVLIGLKVGRTPRSETIAAAEASLSAQLESARVEVAALESVHARLTHRVVTEQQAQDRELAALNNDDSKERTAAVAVTRDEVSVASARRIVAQAETELRAAREKLVGLAENLSALQNRPPHKETLTLRTPVSEAIEGDELHFECRAGRVSFVDIKGLIESAKQRGRLLESEVRDIGRAETSVGPIGGFRLEFTIAREDLPYSQQALFGAGSFRARMVAFRLVGITDPRGESLDESQRTGSEYSSAMQRAVPGKTSCTFWVYPDSFGLFRSLRGELAERGYIVAARPLPFGVPIMGSVNGTRSFGQ